MKQFLLMKVDAYIVLMKAILRVIIPPLQIREIYFLRQQRLLKLFINISFDGADASNPLASCWFPYYC